DDSFTYKLNDGVDDSATATVTMHVVNTEPVARDDGYRVRHDQVLAVGITTGVLANDSDADGDHLHATIATQPQHGSVILAPNGSFFYTPDAHFTGTDSFTYEATDG